MPQPTAAPFTAAITGTSVASSAPAAGVRRGCGASAAAGLPVAAAHHLLHVVARAEGRVGAGDDEAARRGLAHGALELGVGAVGEGVARLGAVDREDLDLAAALDANFLGHAGILSCRAMAEAAEVRGASERGDAWRAFAIFCGVALAFAAVYLASALLFGDLSVFQDPNGRFGLVRLARFNAALGLVLAYLCASLWLGQRWVRRGFRDLRAGGGGERGGVVGLAGARPLSRRRAARARSRARRRRRGRRRRHRRARGRRRPVLDGPPGLGPPPESGRVRRDGHADRDEQRARRASTRSSAGARASRSATSRRSRPSRARACAPRCSGSWARRSRRCCSWTPTRPCS